MLYLIIPPIVVIVTLALLIYFFSRRFPQIEKEVGIRPDTGRITDTGRKRAFEAVKHILLHGLEKLAQWSKVVTLRAHNVLHDWTQSLREKKKNIQWRPKPAHDVPVHKEVVEEKFRPMVSRRMVRPEDPAMKPSVPKEQLEDILVERIATNPRDIEAYERLGEYYMDRGNLQDAKECYRQVLRLSPVHRLAKIKIRRLEKALEQKGK